MVVSLEDSSQPHQRLYFIGSESDEYKFKADIFRIPNTHGIQMKRLPFIMMNFMKMYTQNF